MTAYWFLFWAGYVTGALFMFLLTVYILSIGDKHD